MYIKAGEKFRGSSLIFSMWKYFLMSFLFAIQYWYWIYFPHFLRTFWIFLSAMSTVSGSKLPSGSVEITTSKLSGEHNRSRSRTSPWIISRWGWAIFSSTLTRSRSYSSAVIAIFFQDSRSISAVTFPRPAPSSRIRIFSRCLMPEYLTSLFTSHLDDSSENPIFLKNPVNWERNVMEK